MIIKKLFSGVALGLLPAGGGGLRHTSDIQNGGKVYEVSVDANTGKVLENQAKGPNRY